MTVVGCVCFYLHFFSTNKEILNFNFNILWWERKKEMNRKKINSMKIVALLNFN